LHQGRAARAALRPTGAVSFAGARFTLKRFNEAVHVSEESIAFDPTVAIGFGNGLIQGSAKLLDLDTMGVERLLGEFFDALGAAGRNFGFRPFLELRG
jgi:hypothetical protein